MKLKKISVREFIETFTDDELKNVIGGYDDGEWGTPIDLGEVVITCSGNGKDGRCYECDCVFELPLLYYHTKGVFTGYQKDYCIAGLPC